MSKICPKCGEKIKFFGGGKFIGSEYVCTSCYELNETEKRKLGIKEVKNNDDMGNDLSNAYAKAYKYKSWAAWGSNNKKK
jgi:hypothetical protein